MLTEKPTRGRPRVAHPKTLAERQAAFRQRRLDQYKQSVADFPKWLEAVYLAGFEDGLNGRVPAPDSTWKDSVSALTYINGGFDGDRARFTIK